MAAISVELRAKLRELYSQQFQSIDPGLPGATIGTVHGTAALTLAQRYVPMHVFERREILTAHLTTKAGRQQTVQSGGSQDEDQMKSDMRDDEGGHWESNEVKTRRPLFKWLPDSDRNLIIGEAGDGKSDVLHFDSRHVDASLCSRDVIGISPHQSFRFCFRKFLL